MLTLTLFGVFQGLEIKHLYATNNVRESESSSLIVMENLLLEFGEDTPTVYKISRQRTEDGSIRTWLGRYQHLAQRRGERRGGYYGVGLLFRDTMMDGQVAQSLLSRAVDAFQIWCKEKDRPAF